MLAIGHKAISTPSSSAASSSSSRPDVKGKGPPLHRCSARARKQPERLVPATTIDEIEDDATVSEWENTSEITTETETAAWEDQEISKVMVGFIDDTGCADSDNEVSADNDVSADSGCEDP